MVSDAVSKIAKSLDYACAERLKPNLVCMAEYHPLETLSQKRQPFPLIAPVS
ncbi:MAG TPA: hypothetical protein VFC66_01005 [Anaerolineaceae bacterium]|nr:hypothetical protein [Anaerolineaceae bacterium]